MISKTKWLVGGIVVLGVIGVVAASGNSVPSAPAQSAAVIDSQQQGTVPAVTAPSQQQLQPASIPLSNDNYYTNVSGNTVHSPAYSENGSVSAGATAQCADGTYSFSQHRSGTCSHHGGVAQWLQ